MDVGNILTTLIESEQPLDLRTILDLILPPKTDDSYSLDDIDRTLAQFASQIESLQRTSNDKFDAVLVDPTQTRLMNLSDDVGKTLNDVKALQEDISRARKQFELVKNVCYEDKLVQERREMLRMEERLKRDLQKSKFSSVFEFFKHYCGHLEDLLATCRRLSKCNSASQVQTFDWANYHQVIFLLRACGQALDDLETLERLFQRCKDMFGLSFRQPIDKMDLNNFIEFHPSYSLNTQLDVILNSHGDRCELGKYLAESKVVQLLDAADDQFENRLFAGHTDRTESITTDCCQLLIDLNLDYIEAHLTEGINIDKLNGFDATLPAENPSIEPLPSYAFSPRDYITQIGQHLLALKKQTEKFDQIANRPLVRALGYLKHVKNCEPNLGACESVTEMILKSVAGQIIRSMVGRTTPSVLSQLNANGLKQIATDAMYLDNVLRDLNLLEASDPFVERFKVLFSKLTN
jgi:hypothetical protein